MTDWTTPDDARAEVQRLWDRGKILAAALDGEPLFPYQLKFRRPDSRTLGDRFDEARRWIRSLETDTHASRDAGYEIEWLEVEHRQLGKNRVPSKLIVPTREAALRWIGKLRQAERFDALARTTLERFPVLRAWVTRRPLLLLEHCDDWDRILAVLAWFCEHPRAAIYVRQIDVAGVDTKFVEERRALLTELIDLVLPPEAVDGASVRNFEARYGLTAKPSLIRFRILDPRHRIADWVRVRGEDARRSRERVRSPYSESSGVTRQRFRTFTGGSRSVSWHRITRTDDELRDEPGSLPDAGSGRTLTAMVRCLTRRRRPRGPTSSFLRGTWVSALAC